MPSKKASGIPESADLLKQYQDLKQAEETLRLKTVELEALQRELKERRQTEITLRESEERFSKAFKTSPYAYMIANMEDGAIFEVNDAFTAISGYSREETLANSTINLNLWNNAEDRQGMVATLRKRGAVERMETSLRGKDGTIITALFSAQMIQIGNRSCIISIIEDITKRKQVEKALRESESNYRTLMEQASDAIFISNKEGNYIDANLRACAMFGYSREEILGLGMKDLLPLEEIAVTPIRFKELQSGETVLSERRMRRKDGSVIYTEISGKKLCDGRLLGIVRDITERKRMEEELQRAQKLDALGVLAGGIAHDFNNLLTGIFGYIDLARTASKEPKTKEYLESTIASMNRARALTMQLLTFAKGGSPVQRTTPLFPFIQEAAQFALSGSSVSCRFDVADDLRPCNIDLNQISQVIDNIVINAQQAMPGGGAIEIAARNVSFNEKGHPLLAKGDYVKISIKDSGIGIPKDILPRIFDPFYTTKIKGHGLGLATCHSIINRHGGCIEVESEQERGSTFHVYLPASSEAVVENVAAIVKHRGSGTIIVMDDEDDVRAAVKEVLESLGYAVACKNDGREALDFFISETEAGRIFAAMIFDLTVPGGMGGVEAVKEIRKLNKVIPVFVASGYADNSVMRNPAEHGFTASISKPFTIAELSEMLNKNVKSDG
jgi:PAS domain S-box-containing protein